MRIDDASLRVDTYRDSSRSAVRVTHLPTGTTATAEGAGSQQELRSKALEVLTTRLADRAAMTGHPDFTDDLRPWHVEPLEAIQPHYAPTCDTLYLDFVSPMRGTVCVSVHDGDCTVYLRVDPVTHEVCGLMVEYLRPLMGLEYGPTMNSAALTDEDLQEIERRFLPPQRHFDPDDPRHRGITHTPNVQGGEPCVDGTRMPVRSIMWFWRNGCGAVPLYQEEAVPPGIDAVRTAYPHLTEEEVHAAVAYAADHADEIAWCVYRHEEAADAYEGGEKDEAMRRLIAEVRRLRQGA